MIGLDWSDKYPAMKTPLAVMQAKSAYLDGELLLRIHS